MSENTTPSVARDYKQLIIARKDLNMSPGKLAAQVSHGSMAWLTTAIKRAAAIHYTVKHAPVTDQPWRYRHPDLAKMAVAASRRGETEFFYRAENPDDPYGHQVPCEPEWDYQALITLDAGIYEGWIEGAFTKVVCEARNRNQLLKATTIANELGLRGGEDYFLIKDNCLTELEPEEVDENGQGHTLTVVGFRPLPADVCEKISKKFQLYR